MDRLKKIFEDLFFGPHLRLCPWSLALSIAVLGRAVLGLNLGFFLCFLGLGLEPCVLDSTSAIEQYDNWLEFFCRSVSLSRSISERSVVVKFRRWIGVSVRLKNNRVELDCKRYPQFFQKLKILQI